MRKIIFTFSILVLGFGLNKTIVRAQSYQDIVNSYLVVENISPEADQLLVRLEEEIIKIINTGHLMPFRMQYGERPRQYPAPSHEYAFYEPWGMMLTLGKAYPYVSTQLKTQIIDYIQTETNLYPPWSSSGLGADGSYRQGDSAGVVESGLSRNQYVRRGSLLNALWIYGRRTDDWSDIQPQWSNLQSIYNEIYSRNHNYETISAAIAMARLAHEFGSESLRTQYESQAISLMSDGLDFNSYDSNAIWEYSDQYSRFTEWRRGTYGIAYPLFYLTPEVARYIKSEVNLLGAINSYVYHDPGNQLSNGGGGSPVNSSSPGWNWPLWWMAQAPDGDGGYFGEGVSAGAEQRMMLFNYFAWVLDEAPEKLAYYLDVPDALVGDLYYLQNLVTTIESYGTTCWEDVRTGKRICEEAPSPTPTPSGCNSGDVNDDGQVNLTDALVIIDQWGTSGTGDADCSGLVNALDFGYVLRDWGK